MSQLSPNTAALFKLFRRVSLESNVILYNLVEEKFIYSYVYLCVVTTTYSCRKQKLLQIILKTFAQYDKEKRYPIAGDGVSVETRLSPKFG